MSEEVPPAAEPATSVAAPAESVAPEAPAGTLREQLLALIPDDKKSQAADLLRSLLEHSAAPAPSADKAEEPVSSKAAYRHSRLPFKPRVTREETKREDSKYGSLSDD